MLDENVERNHNLQMNDARGIESERVKMRINAIVAYYEAVNCTISTITLRSVGTPRNVMQTRRQRDDSPEQRTSKQAPHVSVQGELALHAH